jgi:hypothetical protein
MEDEQMAEEFIIGHVATEDHYDPQWETPTWFDLWSKLDEEGITEFVIVPLGIMGSDKRKFGSTSAIVTTEDVLNVLREFAKEQIQAGIFAGDPNSAADVRMASAIIWTDSTFTGELTRRLCFLINHPIHVTGFAITAIR